MDHVQDFWSNHVYGLSNGFIRSNCIKSPKSTARRCCGVFIPSASLQRDKEGRGKGRERQATCASGNSPQRERTYSYGVRRQQPSEPGGHSDCSIAADCATGGHASDSRNALPSCDSDLPANSLRSKNGSICHRDTQRERGYDDPNWSADRDIWPDISSGDDGGGQGGCGFGKS